MESKHGWGTSLDVSAPSASVCITGRLIACSNLSMWWCQDWNIQEENFKNTYIYSTLFEQTCMCDVWAASKTNRRQTWQQETAQRAQLVKFPMLFAHHHLSVMQYHTGLFPLKKLEGMALFCAGREDNLHLFSKAHRHVGRYGPLLQSPPGDQMKAPGFSIPCICKRNRIGVRMVSRL